MSKPEVVHVPLGFSERGEGFEEKQVRLEPGAVVVFHTDGFMEMPDSEGKRWGLPRLMALVGEHRPASPAKIREVQLASARKSLAGQPLDDDLTLVILRRDPV